jgi:hypothetical protein
MLLTLTIPPFIPFQIPSPNTPSFKYLHITNSSHHTSCYHINTHHSFGTKLLTLPIFSYPYHPFIPSHCPYIPSNHQYIYPTSPLIQTLTYQLLSISFTLIYYKLFISSPSIIHRTLTLKYLILYLATNYPIHPHYAIHSKASYHTLPLLLSLPTNHLILPPPCVLYHTLHHSHATSNKKYFPIPSHTKPHSIVSTCLFLLLGGDIEINPSPINHLLRNHPTNHNKEAEHISPPIRSN